MSKQHSGSTPKNPPKIRKLSEVLLEAVRNGNTAAVRAALEKLSPGSKAETVAFDAVREACRGDRHEWLTLLLPYVETTQVGFGILLSECVHADHVACTEVLLQHWKSVCSNVAFVPHDSKDSAGQTSRLCPAMWGDPAVCQVFIGAGAGVETKNDEGYSPLHMASCLGALTTVKMLVEAGADVRATDAVRATCLILAGCFGHTDIVRYLVGLPEVDLNHQDSNNCTALHVAVESKHADVVQVLIDAGADIEMKTNKGHSPLDVASVSGALTTMKMLVKAGADIRDTDTNGCRCLILAAYFGHTDIMRYLVGLPEVDLDHKCTALHAAVQVNHPDIVQVLIDAGTDIEMKNNDGRSPLHMASCLGALTTVKMLVKAGVDLDQRDGNNFTALRAAVKGKHADVVQVLIDAGADIETKDAEGRSPLLLASRLEDLTTMKMLVEAGADVRATDNSANTCLIIAVYGKNTDIVRYLVGLPEVDLDQQGMFTYTALHAAVLRNHTDAVPVLIDAGADIEMKEEGGCSPLHMACMSGELTNVMKLVEAGADVCATDDRRSTCLTYAADLGHTEIVRYLVGLPEVDLNHQDSNNCTALHYAVKGKHPDMVEVLFDAGNWVSVRIP